MATIPAGAPLAAGFDATRWLKEWAEHGGIVILTGDQLCLRRLQHPGPVSHGQLDRLRDEMHRADAASVIADHLRRQREGEISR